MGMLYCPIASNAAELQRSEAPASCRLSGSGPTAELSPTPATSRCSTSPCQYLCRARSPGNTAFKRDRVRPLRAGRLARNAGRYSPKPVGEVSAVTLIASLRSALCGADLVCSTDTGSCDARRSRHAVQWVVLGPDVSWPVPA